MKATPSVPKTIDEYIAAAPREVRAPLEEIRQLVRTLATKAEEVVSYRMPAFRQGGMLLYFAAFKEHIGIFPPVQGDARLEAELAPYRGPKGNLRFPLDRPLPMTLLRKVVKQRLAELAAAQAKRSQRSERTRRATKSKKATAQRAAASPEAALRALVARFEPKRQQLFRAVRTAVRKRLPTANELVYDYGNALVVSYTPSERGIEGIVAIRATADGVALYFHQGPKIPDPTRRFTGSSKETRSLAVTAARELADPEIEAFFAAAIRLAKTPLPASGKGTLLIKETAAAGRAARAQARRK